MKGSYFLARRIICLLLGGWGLFPLSAQTAQLDSLQQELDQARKPKARAKLLNQLAYQSYRVDVTIGKAYAYRALTLSQAHNLREAEVDSYVNLGRCFRLESNWDSANWVLEEALSLSEKAGYLPGSMNASNNLGAAYLRQLEVDSATAWFQRSLAFAQQIPDPRGQANAYNNLAIIAKALDELRTALDYLAEAQQVYESIQDSMGITQSLTNQAFIYDLLEDNNRAIELLFQVLPIQERQGLKSQEANTRALLAELYQEIDMPDKALEQSQIQLTLQEAIGDRHEIAVASTNIGILLEGLKRYQEAASYFQQALTTARPTHDPELIGGILVEMADLALSQGTSGQAQATAYLDEAEPLLLEAESRNIMVLHEKRGDLALKRGDLARAEGYFRQMLASTQAFEDLDGQQVALQSLAQLVRQQGRLAEALTFTDQYHAIKDSLLNAESLEVINRLNIDYDTKKKEADNLRLGKELAEKELESSQRRAQRNLILGITGIVLVIGIGGFYWYRSRQRLIIKEREFELEQERARREQRRKEAEKLRELDAMKTRFFTNVSHEFRTPLTLILGQNEQLQRAVPDETLQGRFEMVDRNGHRLLDLVNQVLDVAKLEAGGMQLEAIQVEAVGYFKQILFAFESAAEEKDITLSVQTNLDKVPTALDVKKMERVGFNLLSNAMKFTPEGGNIILHLQQEEKTLIVGIQDSGVGISAQQLPHIFDRFFQADSSANQPKPGTGIGLSLVKELVELHNGSIQAESSLGEGTTFWIRLPIPEELAAFEAASSAVALQLSPEALPAERPNVQEAIASTDGEQLHILVMEDNPDVRSYVRDQLQSFGYRVSEAPDGREGVKQAQELVPDLILSDVMMPHLDGFGVAEAIRKDARTSHIPLVLLTSKASDDSKIKGFQAGIDDYLLKPFQSDTLRVRLANLIEQRQRLRQQFSEALTIKPEEVSAVPMDQVFLQQVTDLIEAHMTDEQFSVERLSEQVGMSVTHLNRKLKALIGQTAGKLIRSMRLQRAAELLEKQAATVSEIAYDLGFSDPTNFTRAFKKQFGVAPSAYGKD